MEERNESKMVELLYIPSLGREFVNFSLQPLLEIKDFGPPSGGGQ